jgi:hypothetical protein
MNAPTPVRTTPETAGVWTKVGQMWANQALPDSKGHAGQHFSCGDGGLAACRLAPRTRFEWVPDTTAGPGNSLSRTTVSAHKNSALWRRIFMCGDGGI